MGHDSAHKASAARSAPTTAPSPDVDAEHDHDRARRASLAALRRESSKGSPASANAERVAHLIAIVDRHARTVTGRLDEGIAGDIDLGEVNAMRSSLEQERASLLVAVTNLPTGSPLMMRAFAASDRISHVITRLDQLSKTHEKKAERSSELASGSKAELSEAAAAKVPDGYCDTAPQQTAPCHLSVRKREQYRAHIRKVTGMAARNWTAAIYKAQIDEKLKRKELTFEQQLGQLLLGVLFDVIGLAAKAGAHKAIDRADQALGTTYHVPGATIIEGGLEPASKQIAKAGADQIVAKGAPIAQAKLREGTTAQQLAARASQATSIPADRDAFLASIQDAPTQWELSIHHGIDQLLDSDLEALVVGLPDTASQLQPTYFEGRVRDLVTRFQQQVMAVDLAPLDECRPVQVITGKGAVRYGLVRAEKAMSKELHGEWKYVPVHTGKYTFVRWLDEDMRNMAVEKAVQQDATAGAFMRTASDASFWDEKSLQLLAGEHTVPQVASER